MPEMIRSGKSNIERGKVGILSERRYATTHEKIIASAEEILKKGAVLCVTPNSICSRDIPRIDLVFESFIKMSTKEIVLVSPFLSDWFLGDMAGVLFPKKDIVTIITNKAGYKGADDKAHSKVIRGCIGKGYRVKVTEKELHAKIYVFDSKVAIVGSSNLTRYGFFENYEVGMVVFGENCVILNDFIRDLKPKPV